MSNAGDDFSKCDDATIPVAPPLSASGAREYFNLPLPAELSSLLPKGDYDVEKFIGQGGMGAVYKGTQVRLQRTVAIKIMRRDQGRDHGFEERFRREALAMAQLNHPHIVNVIDYGEAGPDFLYIVMEFVDGADLMDVIRSQRMTQDMALKLLPQICDALQFAHDQGIVHRDIKPSNILLTRDGRIKMADFGLAKRLDVDSTFQTQAGSGMGTPDYAAPEQFDPSAMVDHRADIYALGVMIYQMITGHLPRGAWKAPSSRAEVDEYWDQIVSHALQTDPNDRYASASQIKNDLSTIRPFAATAGGPQPSPPQATPPAPASQRQKWKPYPARIYTSVTIAVLAGLGMFLLKNKTPAPLSAKPAENAALLLPATAMPNQPPTMAAPGGATKAPPFTNSLGMKFVPVPGTDVLFCIHETRKGDYAAFAAENPGTDQAWKNLQEKGLPISFADDHPMAGMSRDDAQAFCQWLSKREGKAYRLPTEQEWKTAMSFNHDDKGAAPAAPEEFPWGNQWPPPNGAGNYKDQSNEAKAPSFPGETIENYNDGFPTTAPVMSFAPNQLGIYDLSGNVWEWCEDWHDGTQLEGVIRGGSWNTWGRSILQTTGRMHIRKGIRSANNGFRVVLVRSPGTAAKNPPPIPPLPSQTNLAEVSKTHPFINSLGMKFVPVPITGGPSSGQRVLFSVWATRVQDYQAFVKETSHVWPHPDFEQGPTHPAVLVNWDDAQAFCTWLSNKEGRRYRLPTDHEWSCAIGIGEREDATMPPNEKDKTLAEVYPWGSGWPPPPGSGNYPGEEQSPALEAGKYNLKKNFNYVIQGYRDEFVETAPVGSFPANALGLYDMSGNVWQWVQEWFDSAQNQRVLRGGSWLSGDHHSLFLSCRIHVPPVARVRSQGFRCVLIGDPF